MKKTFVTYLVCTILFVASTVCAVPLLPPDDPETYPPTGWTYPNADTILGYEAFSPADEATDLIFANLVLAEYGLGPTELLNGTGMRVLTPSGPTSINFDPGFAWEYAAVKVDGQNDYVYLFRNDYIGDGANFLTTPNPGEIPYNLTTPGTVPPGPLGISSITFFGPTGVPEPATLILLGLGLLGIAGIRRKK